MGYQAIRARRRALRGFGANTEDPMTSGPDSFQVADASGTPTPGLPSGWWSEDPSSAPPATVTNSVTSAPIVSTSQVAPVTPSPATPILPTPPPPPPVASSLSSSDMLGMAVGSVGVIAMLWTVLK